jgi:DNA-directed RNA polymerase subunit RPC12/RpoP
VNEPIVCITNLLTDFRGCVEADTHYLHALGGDEPDPVRGAMIRDRHLAACHGCLPRHASVGFLCGPCAARVDTALHAYSHFVASMAGIDRAMTAEIASRGKPGSQVPIPPVPLALEEIASFHRSYRGNLQHWASDLREKRDPKTGDVKLIGGAPDAVRFARALRTAERQHPTEERSHDIKITRCPRCGHKTLVWHPPTRFLGDVVVQCEYADDHGQRCNFTIDQTDYETVAAIEQQPRPYTAPNDRMLVFARRRTDAVAWALEHDLRPSDWHYIGSERALRGMSTGHRDRHFLDGFNARRDAQTIRDALTIADLTSLATNAA